MEKLATPKKTKEILNKYELIFRKRFGQNFLIEPRIPEKIVEGARISERDIVLEIGPGIGTLTQYLAEAAGRVVSVEIDKNLLPVLKDTLSGYDNVRLICGDIMKLDIADILEREKKEWKAGDRAASEPCIKVAANLPYYITTPIIMKLLQERLPLESITVMVQKEVARRMMAPPGSPDCGALSLAVNYFTKPCLLANVPPNCFIPRPRVDSAVLRLKLHDAPPVKVKDEALMFSLIRGAFGQRRKTLANSLAGSPELSLSKEEAAAAIEAAGLPSAVRGERLSLASFAHLSDIISGGRGDI